MWRGAATGYAGDPDIQTPNLDRLAAESLDFCNAVSVCPVCTPMRAALMTGRFPTSTGMFFNDPFRGGQYFIDLRGYSVHNGKSIPWKPGTPVRSPSKRHQ